MNTVELEKRFRLLRLKLSWKNNFLGEAWVSSREYQGLGMGNLCLLVEA